MVEDALAGPAAWDVKGTRTTAEERAWAAR
jgi:hypothetical protein